MDKGGRLVNAASGKCMDVLGRGSRQPGMNINLWSCSTSSSDGQSHILVLSLFIHLYW